MSDPTKLKPEAIASWNERVQEINSRVGPFKPNGTKEMIEKARAKRPRRAKLCDCQHPIPTASGFAAVSEDCPIHGGDFQVVTTVL